MRRSRGNHEEEMSARRRSATTLGSMTFDEASGDLDGPDGTARLAPQPATLLALLIERAPDVVTRDEIGQRLWPGGKVDVEQGIAFAVRKVRKAMEEVGGDPGLIETIPKRGLRLHGAQDSTSARGSGRWRLRGPVVGLLLFAAVYAAIRLAAPDPPVVVLFPHDPGGSAPASLISDGLGTAMTAGLTDALGDEGGVIGPTGTSELTGPDDTDGALQELGACLVVSGNLRTLGADSAVVFTQIVRARDRVHVWAEVDTTSVEQMVGSVGPRVVRAVQEALDHC
jgi:DNA-binding winged helix-turn-helix (wHTH) protein/TolB-like protein